MPAYSIKKHSIDPAQFITNLKTNLADLQVDGRNLTANEITVLCLWCLKVITYFQNLDHLSDEERGIVARYGVIKAKQDPAFFWNRSFSTLVQQARSSKPQRARHKLLRSVIAKYVATPLYTAYLLLCGLSHKGGIILVSRKMASLDDQLDLSAVAAPHKAQAPRFIYVKRNYFTHSKRPQTKQSQAFQRHIITALYDSLTKARFDKQDDQGLFRDATLPLVPEVICQPFVRPSLASRLLRGHITAIINFAGDLFTKPLLYQLASHPDNISLWGAQHGAGYREFSTFNMQSEVLSYNNQNFMFFSYDLAAWQASLDVPKARPDVAMGFRDAAGILYPQSIDNAITEAGSNEANVLAHIEAGRAKLRDALQQSDMAVWIKPHPKSNASSWSSEPDDALFSEGLKPKLDKKSIALVVFDSPASTLMLDCLQQGIVFMCVFDKDDYPLTDFAKGFFQKLETLGLMMSPDDLVDDSFSQLSVATISQRLKGR